MPKTTTYAVISRDGRTLFASGLTFEEANRVKPLGYAVKFETHLSAACTCGCGGANDAKQVR